MKIGVVCYPTFGGSGVVATELGIAFSKKGHEVHFITYNQPARLNILAKNIFYHEVSVSRYALFEYPPYELALASKLVNVVKYEKLDVLHVHYAVPHASAAFMAKQILKSKGIDIPIVTTLHGTDITLVGKDPSYEPVVTFSINESNKVTAVSNSLKNETLDFFDIDNQIDVIPNFIDFDKFSKKPMDHFRSAICPNDEKLLVHVSNFRKVKRIDLVIKMFKEVRAKTASKLLLVGDGPERTSLEALCMELEICEDVRFLGKVNAVEDLLSVGDLFVMPSEKESFGLAALEAMACEVPVICTNAGGLPELVEHGISGMISDTGDVENLAKNALYVLKKENLHTFKKNALMRAQTFDISRIMPRYEKLYESAIALSV